ncbi:MAG: hypothetical protein F6J96_19900 [Symploca sp. SIO1C2]|nr:hypothetical protein [Symploca sp. SIO1C2]
MVKNLVKIAQEEAEGRRQKAGGSPDEKIFSPPSRKSLSPCLRVPASPRLFQVRRDEASHTPHTHHHCHINYKSSLMVVSTFSCML